MDKLVHLLEKNEYTISSCESLTGGLFASKLTEIAGVSKVFKGTIVSYWTEVKKDIVGVSKDTIDRYGVVSEQCAYEMANQVKNIFDVDVSVSFTGNAGPSIMENKEVGLVYTCIIVKDKVYNFSDVIKKERNQLREEIVDLTVQRLNDILGKINN